MSDVDSFVKNAKEWREEIMSLRSILLSTPLEEGFKWSKPCYSFDDSNVVIIQPFKACLALMFFKGALLKDPKSILKDQGPNSRSARRIEFRSLHEIVKLESKIKAYIKEAIAIEKSGQKVDTGKRPTATPNELLEMFKLKPSLKKAFDALTPGRQRAYLLYFSSAKQESTRLSRIKKCMPKILEGKGINDH